MAKQLSKSPPSSSVARLLDLGAAARAVASNESAEPLIEVQEWSTSGLSETTAPVQAVTPRHRKVPPKRELVLTPDTDEVLSRLVELYRRATGTRLTTSHVARAILKGAAHCMHHLEREARRIGAMNLPSNAQGRELERERFEARLADAFIAGIRSSPAMERDP